MGIGECLFEIDYKLETYLCDNDTVRLINISKLEIYPNGANCPSNSILMDRAVQWLLFLSPWKFNISDPENPFDIVMKIPICVSRYTKNNPPPVRYFIDNEKCGNVSCCSATFTLQRVDTSMIIRNSTYDNNDFTQPCGGGTNDPCENNCGSFSYPDNYELDFSYGLPCDYPCPDIKFEYTSFYNIYHTLTRDYPPYYWTTYRVGYTTRECQDLLEFSIPAITEFTGSPNQFTLNEILQGAIKELLYNVDVKFNKTLPCTVVVRTHKCWAKDDYGNMYPCGNVSCCSSTYSIYEENGKKYAVLLKHDEGYPTNCAGYCMNICSSHLLPSNPEPLPIKIPTNIDENSNNFDNKIKIIPHPAKDETDIIFYSNENGNVQIQIYDNLGNLVYENNKSKNTKELIFRINASKIPSGIYYLNLKIDGKLITNKKFVIKN